MKIWNNNQIKNHTEAAKKLGLIKDEFALFVKKKGVGISEKECLEFIKKSYKRHGLVNDDRKEFAIVAFGQNTKEVHYFPSAVTNLKLQDADLILLDIWARLDKKNTPYADATFMFFFGKKIPNEIQKKWKVLTEARDIAIKFIENEISKNKLPRGLDIDRVAHDVIGNAGFGRAIKHTIGHSLGFKHPHGDLPGINWKEYSSILKNIGYTIEPGMYFDNFGLPSHKSQQNSKSNKIKKIKELCWGMRTEIDFYISDNNRIIITTPLQKKIDII